MAYGDITKKVLDTLAELGPMTAKDLAQELDMRVNNVSMVLTRCGKKHIRKSPKAIKRVYIHSWVPETYTKNGREFSVHRMVFAVGDKKNAPKPKPQSTAARCKKTRQNKLRRISNIFEMGAKITGSLFNG